MDRTRKTAPAIEGYVASEISNHHSHHGASQAWHYHHASDYRPDGRKVRVHQSLETGVVSIWRDDHVGQELKLATPWDTEIVAAVRGMSHGYVVDMSSDLESAPARAAAKKLIEAGFEYGDYLGRYAWIKADGRHYTALLALDENGASVLDDHDDPITYPGLSGGVAVCNSWNVHEAFALVGHETIAPNLDAAIELVRGGLMPFPNIADHGLDEAEIDRLDEDDTLQGIKARDEYWNRSVYKQVDFDYADLVMGAPKP